MLQSGQGLLAWVLVLVGIFWVAAVFLRPALISRKIKEPLATKQKLLLALLGVSAILFGCVDFIEQLGGSAASDLAIVFAVPAFVLAFPSMIVFRRLTSA